MFKLLIIGFGYVGQHIAQKLIPQGFLITATTRDPEKAKCWENTPINVIPYPSDNHPIDICPFDYILITTPPSTDGRDPGLSSIKLELIREPHHNHIKWIGYISSTSVYGDHQGRWVSEESPPINPGNKGWTRLLIEKEWMTLHASYQLPIHIYRVAGIYGEGRNSLSRILNGKKNTVIKKGQIFSRIHIDDICQILEKSIMHPTAGEIYNLADDLPCPPEVIDEYAAKLLNVSPPMKKNISECKLSAAAAEFYAGSKKVSNKKIKEKLQYQFLYPTYETGLLALYSLLSAQDKNANSKAS